LLQGNTTVKIWRGQRFERETISQYPTQLPGLLQNYGLDPAITRLELDQDNLETIMLRLINNKPEAQQTAQA
jgi:hypothetical protein